MKRVANGCLTLILLWTLVPGVGEFTENFVHLVMQGHTAHAVPDGDTHAPPGPEHGCNGVVHFCSCCISQTFLSNQFVAQVPEQSYQRLAEHARVQIPSTSGSGTYRPPRA